MKPMIPQRLVAALLAIQMVTAPVTVTASNDTVTGDKGSDMLIDLVVVRPIGAVGTVLGAAVFVVALPFTIPTGNVGESAREMIGKPAEYTFNRPLGEFHRCGADRHPCGD